jgi:3-dehydroquinate synthase
MEAFHIQTNAKEYPLMIGEGIINHLASYIKEQLESVSKILVITDETVGSHYLKTVVKLLEPEYPIASYIIPDGEKAKSVEIYYKCQTEALSEKLDRSSLIIALGGGVVGDLAGFVAATYMRGIPFIQIPTTLLAHDSAVGGKVAINHELGKNMIGAFYQPEAVIYDINFLKTLPEKELRSGYAEVIKHALIKDVDLYHLLRNEVSSLSDLQGERLEQIILKGIKVKAEVVAADEKEHGIRAYLNFGHTLGHAIEAELGYGQLTHGDAVAIGMLYAIKVSEQINNTDLHYEEFVSWFKQYGFPTSIPSHLNRDKLIDRMKRDKKSKEDKIRMVLLNEIGSVEVKIVNEDLLRSLMSNEEK